MKKELSIPEQHQLRIARQTLQMNDVMANIMGGMTKDEARQVIFNLTGKRYWKTPEEKSTIVDMADANFPTEEHFL